MAGKQKIIVVTGTTGVGKTALGILLAKQFKGEIINADAMQYYTGLPIATNKALSEVETQGVPHHLLNTEPSPTVPFLGPGAEQRNEKMGLDVRHWVKACDELIAQLAQRDRLPIIVGGTNYWTNALLWRTIGSETSSTDASRESFAEEANTDAYERLKEVDPESAKVIHPNDHRKVKRALAIFDERGQTMSDLIKTQSNEPVYDALILQPYLEKDVLDPMLRDRVDEMMQRGLLEEILQFRGQVPFTPDFGKGIWQAIGCKEFEPYYQRVEAKDEQCLAACVEQVKINTVRYAIKQLRWIRHSLQPLCRSITLAESPACFTSWSRQPYFFVFPKKEIQTLPSMVEQFLTTKRVKDAPDSPTQRYTKALSQREMRFCDVCQRTIQGADTFQQHIRGRSHRRRKRGNGSRQKMTEDVIET